MRWFPVWMLVGAAFALGIISVIGVVVLPIAVVAALLLARARAARPAYPGVIAGAGLPLLYVSWLNRSGPGNVCTFHNGGQDCVEQFNPWPWFLLGAALLATGILLAVI